MNKSDFYNGNPNLPKAGVKKQFTETEFSELLKCQESPIYMAKKYFKIINLDKGLMNLDLYDYQEEALEKFMETGKLIMATARQCGKSTCVTVPALHHVLFNPYYTVAIVANKKSSAKDLLNRIKLAYEKLPKWLQGGVKEWNKESVEFENGSKIIVDATNGNSIRGKSINFLIIDEMAFIQNFDEFSASVLPTLSSGKKTKMIIISTPNGLNHFYQYYKNAKECKNGFSLVEVPWFKVPGRDEKWKQKTLEEMNFNYEKFAQEQEVSFSGSSTTLINGATLKRLNFSKPIHFDQNIKMYHESSREKKYIMTVDVSRGKGLDYSTFIITDITKIPYKQVCCYRNNMILPIDFANICYNFSKHYNECSILVENNDLGGQVADCLWELEASVINTESKGRLGKQISYSNKSERGIRTTRTVKSEGCSMLKLLLEQDKYILYDKETISELNTFVSKNGSFEAESGKHDDLVMNLVLFSWLVSIGYIEQITDESIQQALSEFDDSSLYNQLMPFGVILD